MGSIDEKEFIKLFTFSHLPPSCLLQAGQANPNQVFSLEQLSNAVQNLGVPLASVIVGINFSCSNALLRGSDPLNSTPPYPCTLWKKICIELMTFVELGYRFGSKVRELGPAAGCLAGFGVGCGMLVALKEAPEQMDEWISQPLPRPSLLEYLGAELSQVSGFMIQQLGYGHEAALGAAFGSGTYSKATLAVSPDSLVWIGASRWIEALRHSRNYPREVALRSIFPSITPPTPGSGIRNATLEALYADVGAVVREGSKLTWHLPKSSYENTERYLLSREVSPGSKESQ
jgi:hypothetical protein